MFVCGPEKDAKKRMDKLGDLKQLVEAIEEKMVVPCSVICNPMGPPPCITEAAAPPACPPCPVVCCPISPPPCTPCPVVCCPICPPPCPEPAPCPPCPVVCCPTCCTPCPQNTEVAKAVPLPEIPPDVMVCYRVGKSESRKPGRNAKKDSRPKRTKRAKSRELRGGILYIGCDCEKRNGLQDDCPRTGCHGSPECLTKPEPICGPSEFSNGKHLYKNKTSQQGGNNDCSEGGTEYSTVYYNCYPATIKC